MIMSDMLSNHRTVCDPVRDPVRDHLHDLRNLFGVVSAGAHLLAHGPAPERKAMVLRAMDDAALRGSDILSTMRAGLADREPDICLLPERLARLAPLLMTMAGAGVHLHLDLSGDSATAECSGQQIDRVILELVTNARRATPSEGNIYVRVRTVPGAAWLIVADTGTGTSPAQVASMIGKGAASREGARGTGMGQVRALVAKAKGHLRVRSKIGAGTVVALILPTCAEATRDYGQLRMGGVASRF